MMIMTIEIIQTLSNVIVKQVIVKQAKSFSESSVITPNILTNVFSINKCLSRFHFDFRIVCYR